MFYNYSFVKHSIPRGAFRKISHKSKDVRLIYRVSKWCHWYVLSFTYCCTFINALTILSVLRAEVIYLLTHDFHCNIKYFISLVTKYLTCVRFVGWFCFTARRYIWLFCNMLRYFKFDLVLFTHHWLLRNLPLLIIFYGASNSVLVLSWHMTTNIDLGSAMG